MSHPLVYEINTRCWLAELSVQRGRRVQLIDVPDAEFQSWEERGFSHIWLMGVWSTGRRSRAQTLGDSALAQICRQLLPDFKTRDIIGSPYAIERYEVSNALGGDSGLIQFRQRLNRRGMKLLLDFVPNHFGLDHRWVSQQPELLVSSLEAVPETFPVNTTQGTRWVAHGKDPNFPAWVDTVQLDYRRADTQTAMTELLATIAERCDGVRCDMAMLVLKHIFARTWARSPCLGPETDQEFWARAIGKVREAHPNFLLLAEAYWGLEDRLLSIGFDYTYHKPLYDTLACRRYDEAQPYLIRLGASSLTARAHFLENHDEHRAAAIFSPEEHRAAALVTLSLPGMRLIHEGQLTGATQKIPVQLGRRPVEPSREDITNFYADLLTALQNTAVGRGRASILEPRPAWVGNPSARFFVIAQWQVQASAFDLVVTNLAGHRSQCRADLQIEGLAEWDWRMEDRLGTESYERCGADLQSHGLFLDLPAHGAQLFHFSHLPRN